MTILFILEGLKIVLSILEQLDELEDLKLESVKSASI